MNHPEDAMFLEQLGVCKLCQLRLLDGPTFHSYSFPRRYMDFLVDKVDSVCVVCFGLLQSLRISHAAAAGPVESSDDVISQIIQVVMSSSYRFSGFQLNISEPADISLRDRAVWALLAERHQQAASGGGDERLGDISAVADVAVPAKVVFRNLAYALIKEQLLKLNGIHKALFESDIPGWFDPSTEQVSILVSFNLLDPSGVSKLYMDRLTDAVRQTCPPRLWSSLLAAPKKSRRRRPFGRAVQEPSLPEASTVSRTSIKQLLSLLPDNVFLQKVIHLQKETAELSQQSIRVQLLSVEVSRVAPLVVAGRYVKLCRKLPQTPWILDGERKLETSVEELIAAPLVSAFGPGTKYNFVSSGREDIDVRCLGLGRPFMLEISNYAHTLAFMLTEEGKLRGEKTPSDNSKNSADSIDVSQILSAPGDLSWMARRINLSTDCRVFVRDLQVMPLASASSSLKQGEAKKSKRYRAVCWCSDGGLSTARIRRLEAGLRSLSGLLAEKSTLQWPPLPVAATVADLPHSDTFIELPGWEINQLTPIRVLHRRTQACRQRKIHWLRLADFCCVLAEDAPFALQDFRVWAGQYPTEELFLLELCCEAGTYVKELVHGDFGRTQPNLSSLLGCPVDLLALDVVAVDHDWPPCLPDPGL